MNFTFSVDIDVRFRDTDAMGHVNNAVYLTYCEIARTAYLHKMTGFATIAEVDFVVARVECNYRHSALYGQVLRVECGATRLGDHSFTLAYRITADNGSVLIADAVTVMVWFDYATHKPKGFPDGVRARMQEYDAALLAG